MGMHVSTEPPSPLQAFREDHWRRHHRPGAGSAGWKFCEPHRGRHRKPGPALEGCAVCGTAQGIVWSVDFPRPVALCGEHNDQFDRWADENRFSRSVEWLRPVA